MAEFSKGLYLLWPDMDYIKKSTDAGINQLLIANQNTNKEDDFIHDHWGRYDETQCLIRLLDDFYKDDTQTEFIFLPLWLKHYKNLPDDQKFFANNIFYNRVPCPISCDWINQRAAECAELMSLAKNKKIKKLLFDAEFYLEKAYKTQKSIDYHASSKGPKNICHCQRCQDLNIDNIRQWDLNRDLVKDQFEKYGIRLMGQLEKRNAWNYQKYNDHWYFTEKTYPVKNITHDNFKLNIEIPFDIVADKARARVEGIHLKVSAGIWVERFKANELLNYISKIGENPAFDGYWFYPQLRFSKYSKIERVNSMNFYTSLIDAPGNEFSDPAFFEKLLIINQKIDHYRKSWQFKIKKILFEQSLIKFYEIFKK